MSRFYGDLQGSRGGATRQGTTKSGIHAHVRGWNIGVRVTVRPNDDGDDEVLVYRTRGSNQPYNDKLIARFTGRS